MKTSKQAMGTGMSRRDALKLSGLALGGLAVGGAMVGAGVRPAGAGRLPQCDLNACHYPVPPITTQQYTYPKHLDDFVPGTPLDRDEMRITFMGTAFPPARKAQQMMSIFVEVGGAQGQADQVVFDCGAGVIANYNAMGVSYGRMDKIFLTHLHADHMSDLTAIYCFGPSEDRKSPLYVWGQSRSGVMSPAWGLNPETTYEDGTIDFCTNLRNALRWHSESFSFLTTSYGGYPTPAEIKASWGLPYEPAPVPDDPWGDGYALVPIELDWQNAGPNNVAYDNQATGVKITHFPVIHCRKGSMGYKLEWNGLSMIYTSDTRPETVSIAQASNNVDPYTHKPRAVDVFIHEMILPPELLAMKNMGLAAPNYGDPRFEAAVLGAKRVIDSSHSPQGAVGYLLSQITPHPRLTTIAHFPVADDTVACALNSVRAHCPWVVWDAQHPNKSNLIWATDLMVLRVYKDKIYQLKATVPAYAYGPPQDQPQPLNAPKYATPTDQLDLSTFIPPFQDQKFNYCEDGY